jgi:hypothetical protein
MKIEAVVGEVGRGLYHLLDGSNPERIVIALEAIGIGSGRACTRLGTRANALSSTCRSATIRPSPIRSRVRSQRLPSGRDDLSRAVVAVGPSSRQPSSWLTRLPWLFACRAAVARGAPVLVQTNRPAALGLFHAASARLPDGTSLSRCWLENPSEVRPRLAAYMAISAWRSNVSASYPCSE